MNTEELARSARKLLEHTNSILEIRRRASAKPGERFNIFSIMGAESDEVNTHCRLLYELLSPDGCHGMGDSFLHAFCEMVLHKPCPPSVSVFREWAFSDGRIDLLIEGENVCYPIEVKIYAGDQYLQISRYTRFAEKASEHHVYYLTLDGHEPSKESTGDDPIPNLTCLSFAGEIRAWLVKCCEMAWQAPAITQTLRQYIEVIDQLSGSVQEDEYMMQIQKAVGASRENFESALAVSAALGAVKAEKMREVLREIETHISNRFSGEQLSPCTSIYEDESNIYYDSTRRQAWPGLIYPLTQRKCGDLQLALLIEIDYYDGSLFYGLVPYKGGRVQVPDEVEKLADAFPDPAWKRFITESPHRDRWWLWYKKLQAQKAHLDFKNCNEPYRALYDPERYREIMDQIFAELDQGIDSMLETGLPKDIYQS